MKGTHYFPKARCLNQPHLMSLQTRCLFLHTSQMETGKLTADTQRSTGRISHCPTHFGWIAVALATTATLQLAVVKPWWARASWRRTCFAYKSARVQFLASPAKRIFREQGWKDPSRALESWGPLLCRRHACLAPSNVWVKHQVNLSCSDRLSVASDLGYHCQSFPFWKNFIHHSPVVNWFSVPFFSLWGVCLKFISSLEASAICGIEIPTSI